MTFLKHEIKHYGHALGVNFDAIDIILNDTTDHPFDDIYGYELKAGRGKIYGNSRRSLLLAFYALLEGLGVRFVAPNDERLPTIDLAEFTLKADIRPKARHRIICIEGSATIEHVLSMIDFLLKIGMNGYFIQFDNPFVFFERYEQETKRTLGINREMTRAYKKQIEDEMKKRDLILHAVGHGWTTRILGLDGDGWYERDSDVLTEDMKAMIAMKNEKRTFFKGIPLNTQLCYSDPKVQNAMTKAVVEYVKSHPEVDVLHVWLADDFDNFCECERCRSELPSAQYVRMLNAIDAELSREKIPTRIAFLAYYELLEPSELKIENEDRFILMFAPITRTYLKSFGDVTEYEKPEKGSGFPTNLSENLGFLKAWKQSFSGDSFLFDYHLMWDGFKEPTQLGLARTLHADLMELSKLGLNGFISCQLTRNAFPNALAQRVMGRTLVEGSFDLESLEKAFFKDTYGSDGIIMHELFDTLYDPLIHAYFRREVPMDHPDIHDRIAMCKERIRAIRDGHRLQNDQSTVVLDYLDHVYDLVTFKSVGDETRAKVTLKHLMERMETERPRLDASLDYFYMAFILNEFITTNW